MVVVISGIGVRFRLLISGKSITDDSLLCVFTVPPLWKVEPRDSSVVLGHSVIIDCQSDGDPDPVVTWKKDDSTCTFFDKTSLL